MENKEIKKITGDIARIAQYLWERGWAERNAGNISVNITGLIPAEEKELFVETGEILLPETITGPAGHTFLMTGTGTRMRDVAIHPDENLCMVSVNASGTGYRQRCLCREAGELQPTSELPAHMAVHETLSRLRPESKVLIHTHATELIALTHLPGMKTKQSINRMLWGMHPETLIFLPEGTGLLSYMLPGTCEIAHATAHEFEKHPVVIWEKHGVLATGKSIDEAFDRIDLVLKPVKIYFQCMNAGFNPEGLTDLQLQEIRKIYLD
jgi:rhamnulose-1-phosphate aldolase